ESNWVADFAKKNPLIKVLNCTEGGIGFPGVENLALKDAAQQFLTQTYPVDPLIKDCLKSADLFKDTKGKIAQGLEELHKSLQECVDWLQILIEEEEELLKPGKKVTLTQQSGRAVLAETELLEQPGFVYVLEVFNAVFGLLFRRELAEI